MSPSEEESARYEAAEELQEWLYRHRYSNWTRSQNYVVWCQALEGLGVNMEVRASIGASREAVERGKVDPAQIKAIFTLLFL